MKWLPSSSYQGDVSPSLRSELALPFTSAQQNTAEAEQKLCPIEALIDLVPLILIYFYYGIKWKFWKICFNKSVSFRSPLPDLRIVLNIARWARSLFGKKPSSYLIHKRQRPPATHRVLHELHCCFPLRISWSSAPRVPTPAAVLYSHWSLLFLNPARHILLPWGLCVSSVSSD